MLLLQLQYVMCLLFSAVQYYVIKSYFLVVVFFWLGQSSSGAICTTIHLFTHVHGIQHHSSSSIYNMYVVLLQERWYTSIYGMVVLFYSSPLFFSSSQSFSLCYVICSTFLDLSPCSDPLYINSPTTIVVCWQKTSSSYILILLQVSLSHLHQQFTASSSSSSKRYWNFTNYIYIYTFFSFLHTLFKSHAHTPFFFDKIGGELQVGLQQCVNQFFLEIFGVKASASSNKIVVVVCSNNSKIVCIMQYSSTQQQYSLYMVCKWLEKRHTMMN